MLPSSDAAGYAAANALVEGLDLDDSGGISAQELTTRETHLCTTGKTAADFRVRLHVMDPQYEV